MRAVIDKNAVNPVPRDSFSASEPLSLVSICLDNRTLELLKAFAETSLLVQVSRHVSEYLAEEFETAAEWTEETAPEICLIDFDRDRQQASVIAERIKSHAPSTSIFAVSAHADPSAIIDAMRAGCTEYLLKPLDREQIVGAIARVVGRKKDKKDARKAQVFAFLGVKGGCGVTTLVTHLGSLLARTCSRSTLILDLHPDCGDVPLYLGLGPNRFHFFDLLENAERLDSELIQSFIVRHSSGVDVICAPEESEPFRQVNLRSLARTFEFLRSRYEFILIDLPTTLTEEAQELIRHAEALHLVTTADVAPLRNVVRHLEYFGKSDRAQSVRVVLNRFQKNSPITEDQIHKTIRQDVYWRVPDHPAHVTKAHTSGDPSTLAAASDVARSMKEWAVSVGARPTGDARKKGGRGILGLWNR
jgi:pilus assembly protein CpaE